MSFGGSFKLSAGTKGRTAGNLTRKKKGKTDAETLERTCGSSAGGIAGRAAVCVYAARTREEIQQERENKKNEQKSTQSQYKESQGKLNDLEEEQEVLQEEINELDAQLVEVIASVSLMEDQIVETEGRSPRRRRTTTPPRRRRKPSIRR